VPAPHDSAIVLYIEREATFSDATIVSSDYRCEIFVLIGFVWSHALNPASCSLETIIAKALHRAPADESALLAWTVACGSAVAERTRALSFSDGILQIEVADREWRRELASLAPRYLALINKYSATPVKRIEFVVKANL
jgi:hypothetical protein